MYHERPVPDVVHRYLMAVTFDGNHKDDTLYGGVLGDDHFKLKAYHIQKGTWRCTGVTDEIIIRLSRVIDQNGNIC